MKLPVNGASYRNVFLSGFLLCLGALCVGLYLQLQVGLEPCPLCIIQRWVMILAGLICLAGAIHNSDSIMRRVYGFLTMFVADGGAVVAGRQLWLQQLPPDQVPACGPGLEYMMENLPLKDTLSLLFSGSGECAEVTWQFLGLSIAGWSMGIFIILIVLGVYQGLRA